MSKRNLFFLFLIAIAFMIAAVIPISSQNSNGNSDSGLSAGRNVNMASGTTFPEGDPYLQRQNEPSIAVSTRNPLHLLAGANDYRSLNIPFEDIIPGSDIQSTAEYRDAWLGVFKSFDGGQSWTSTLMPGYPQDTTPEGLESPIYGLHAAADPTVRPGPNGLFFYSGIAFDRIEKGNSKIFVARFIDNNNKETGDPIKYLDTTIIDTGTSGQFTDKPWIAIDIPRDGSSSINIDGQTIPSGNVYIVYSIFLGNLESNEIHSKILFARSFDYGQTWEHPIKLSESQHINQGTTLAISPDDGTIYVAWRRFGSEGEPDAIVTCHSKDGGQKFSKAVEVATIDAFDQPTSQITFRSNCYPSMTVDDSGHIYLAWSQRTYPAPGEWSRIVMSTSNNGVNWSETPMPVVDEGESGHQFMPALTFAGGKLTMLWYDQRYDVCENFDYYIDEVYATRHTIDVRAAQANPSLNPLFLDSIQVSRYPLYLVTNSMGEPIGVGQLKYNMPNLPIFQHGTVPFMGDYIDIAPSPLFVQDGNGWAFNTNEKTVYHAAWTDNRDVIPPGLGDEYEKWYEYSAPGAGCNSGQVGVRNQNIYTSLLSSGIIAGSPGNTKPLNTDRAFVVFVKNSTGVERYLNLEIDAPDGITAYFMKSGVNEGNSLSVTVLPYSSISTTVMVEQSEDLDAMLKVNVYEGANLITHVLLNPDSTNPFLEDPDVDYPTPHVGSGEFHTPHVGSSDDEFWNYSIANPHVGSSEWMDEFVTPHVGSEDYFNNDWVTPHVGSSDYDEGNFAPSDIANPHVGSDDFPFSFPEVSTLQDYMLDVQNKGNTTSSYSLDTFPIDIQEGIVVQMIVYKIYTTPNAIGCDLKNQEHHQLILNVHNIDYQSGSTSAFSDFSFSLAPGERCRIIYRIYNPTGNYESNILSSTSGNGEPYLSTNSLVPKIDADAPNEDGPVPSALVIKTTSLPDGVNGQLYGATVEPYGGLGSLAWTLLSGSLPPGLSFDNGSISGTPTSTGIFEFTVEVTDSGTIPQTATQELSIRIAEPLEITTSTLDDGIGGQAYGESLYAIGGFGAYTWTLASGSLPDGLELFDSGVISESLSLSASGTFTFTVQVNDESNPQQTDTRELSISIFAPLGITTASLNDGIVGDTYSESLAALGGTGSYTWILASGNLPDGLNLIDGSISGTPTATGTFNFTVQVNDSGTPPQTSIQELSIQISEALVIITTTLDDGITGVHYSKDLVTGGFAPYLWSILSDSLPPGLSLSGTGISGTPTATGTFNFTVKVDDSGNPGQTASQTLSIRISNPLTITTIALNDGVLDWPYSANLMASEGHETYTWALTSGALPAGLSLNSNGAISGAPTVAGSSQFTAEVRDDSNPQQTASQLLTILILDTLDITTTSLDPDQGFLGSLYSAALEATGGLLPYTWSIISGALPPGLDIIGNEIKGIPVFDSNAIYPQEYSFTIQVEDSYALPIPQTAAQELKITINPKKEEKLAAYEGPGDDEATAVTTDSQGNIYVTGYISSATTGKDFHTVKYDTTGNKQWEATYEGPADDEPAAITVDSTGVYVTGYSAGGTTGPDYFTVKYDPSNGNVLWQARYDGPSHLGDYATAIAVDSAGNVYVTGYSYRGQQTKHSDYCTVKYDSNGNLIWDVRYDSRRNGMDEASAIAVDTSGNVYITGKSKESLARGEEKKYDYYTVKYNSSGRTLWEVRYNGPTNGDDEATAIALDSSGVYVTGRSMGSGNNFDYYTAKYDIDNGSTLWELRYNDGDSDEAVAIALDSLGVYVTGKSIASGNNSNYYTVKYNNNSGGKNWDATYDAGATGQATDIAVDSDGNVYVTGFATGATTGMDCFTIKYDKFGAVIWVAKYDGLAHLGDYAAAIAVNLSSVRVYVVGYSTGSTSKKDFLILKY
jgi:hypothetical protein